MVTRFEYTPAEKITRAIVEMQVDQPFFADLAMSTKIMPLPKDAPVPFRTMCVNARGEMFFDESYVEGLSMPELRGTIMHEVMHLAFSHISRIGSRDRLISNYAQDVVVNHFVIRAGGQLPNGVVPYDQYHDSSTFKLNGEEIIVEKVSEKSWEEIYEQLKKFAKPQQGKGAAGAGDGKDGNDKSQGKGGLLSDFHDYGSVDEMTEQEKQEKESYWRERVVDSMTRAKARGSIPGGMERLVDDLLEPKVDWRAMLLRYLKMHTSQVDWSYSKPHRKSQALEVYMPNVHRETTEIDVMIDTSGSIGREELTEFLSEVAGMARAMPYLEMHVSFCDTKLHDRTRVDDDIQKIVSLRPKGGGGTDLEAGGLDELKKMSISSPAVIVLTDGETPFNRKRSDYPFQVIWCVSKDGISDLGRIPYGHKVKLS